MSRGDDCPLYCNFCGAKLRLDSIGHYCPTPNCQWQYGVEKCPIRKDKNLTVEAERDAGR
jgi:hypothetical protein